MNISENRLTILIVEDDLDYAKYLKILLNKVNLDLSISQTHNFKDTVNILLDNNFDLILSDLGLPETQGLETLDQILKYVDDHTPIVILTNLDDEEIGVEALNRGAIDYIPKKMIRKDLLKQTILYAIERSKILATIEEQKEQIMKMQKMEALIRLVGGITHDFNNIITTIDGYSQLIRNKTQNEKIAKYGGEIKKASDRAASLIRRLQTFSSKEKYSTEIVDMDIKIREYLALIQDMISENIELEYVLNANNAKVEVVEDDIEQIIINLVSNAVDSIEKYGTITISTQISYRCEICNIETEMVKVTVNDTGSGISNEIQDQIFDPYFTTKKGGTGLGLAIVYGIIQKMGGGIHVNSSKEEGTSFVLHIPISDQQSELDSEVSMQVHKDKQNYTILIVDDETQILTMLSETLKNGGYKIITSDNPLTISEKIVNGEIFADLILSDVVMPKMSGTELYKKVTDVVKDQKFLMMSGYSEDYYLEIKDLGLELIRKPFSLTDVQKRIEKIFNSW